MIDYTVTSQPALLTLETEREVQVPSRLVVTYENVILDACSLGEGQVGTEVSIRRVIIASNPVLRLIIPGTAQVH